VGINIVHRDSRIIETNTAYERITGYTADEMKGMSFKTITHPDDLARNAVWFENCCASDEPVSEMQKRYIRKDGRTIWARLVNSRLDNDYSISIVEDITERKEAEARLQATASRLQAILENAPVGIVTGDRQNRFVETNAAFQRMTGYSGEELRHMQWQDVTHPDDIEMNAARVNGLMSGELRSYDFEKRYLLKNGKTIWGRVVGSRLDEDHKISIIEDITERKEAQARLHATAERLQAILEHAPVGINIVDPRNGRILESNAAFQRIIGYSAEELKGMTIEDYTHPDDLPHNLALLDGMNKGNWSHYELEKRNLQRDGKIIWVRARRARLNDDLSIGIIEDVTERKQAVEQLRRSEARFRGLIESSIVGVLVGCPDGRINYTNDAFLALTGYTREDVKAGLHWRDLSPAEYQPLVDQNLEDLRRIGRFRPYEKEYFRKDGSRVPVMVGGAMAEGGETVVFVVDLTERKEQQLELERLARIVESADDAIVSLSLQGIILSWNEGAQRLFGYSKAEMIGASEDILLPSDNVAETEAIRKVLATGKGLDHFWAVRVTKSGELKPVGLTISPVTDALGKIIGISKIARDRTQILKAQQLEEQLRQSQKLESLGRLAGGVAHDFNNLLMVISSYTEMLQDRVMLNEKGQKYTQQILKAADRAASLAQQMLAFSRKQVLAPRVLDLNATIEDTAKMIKRLIGEDIELIFQPGTPLAAIEADPSQITQVLLNLCVNARDAMPQGGIITIATTDAEVDAAMASRHTGLHTGSYVMLTVSDTGLGMTREVQERIFEPFFTTKPTGQGTGLGLSTVYGIVKQSNGYIWVQSELGQGTSFKLYFPITQKQPVTARPRSAKRGKGRGETILVVEDEMALRSSVCEHLEGHGYCVLEAPDGQGALELAASHDGPIDILLTDVIMPSMSGPETAERLLQLPDRHDVVTLYMSGYPDDAIVNHGVSEPGVALIQKPFSLGTLTEKVQELLAARSNGGASAAVL
jgi:PAS domain S-box-containing protein